MSLVLTEGKLAYLSGNDHTNNGSVLLDTVEISSVVLLGVGVLVLLLDVLAEGLLLGVHPVLVESALDISVHVLGEDGGKGAETTRGLDVTNYTDDLKRRALNDGGGVDNILLDRLLTFTTLLILDDVGHTGLVSHESGEMDWLAGVVAGEGSNATTMMSGTSLGEEGERAASGMLELSVGHIMLVLLLYLIMIKRACK